MATVDQYTDAEWDWLVAEAKTVARRDAGEQMPWHKAFAIGLIEATKRLARTEEGDVGTTL